MVRRDEARRWLACPAVVVMGALLTGPAAWAQPIDSAPPPGPPAPPPVVQNVPPPPVVQNVPPPPVVQNAAPLPVVQNTAPLPIVPPPDLEQAERRNGKLLLSGLGTYVLAYGLTVLLGAIRSAEDDPAASRLYIPVLGPLLFWDGTNLDIDGESGGYLILSTLAQTAGLLGVLFGIFEMAGADTQPGGG